MRELVGCVEAELYQQSNFTRIASERCAHLTRPVTTLACGTSPCPQWRAGPWGSVSRKKKLFPSTQTQAKVRAVNI